MAGLNPEAVREALAQQLANNIQRGVGVHAYAPMIDPNDVPAYPAILIGHADPSTQYEVTFGPRGIATMHLEVEVRTQSADGVSAERLLDQLWAAGDGQSSSVFDALNTARDLGGVVSTMTIVSARAPRPLGNGVWSAAYVVAVHQPRSS